MSNWFVLVFNWLGVKVDADDAGEPDPGVEVVTVDNAVGDIVLTGTVLEVDGVGEMVGRAEGPDADA